MQFFIFRVPNTAIVSNKAMFSKTNFTWLSAFNAVCDSAPHSGDPNLEDFDVGALRYMCTEQMQLGFASSLYGSLDQFGIFLRAW